MNKETYEKVIARYKELEKEKKIDNRVDELLNVETLAGVLSLVRVASLAYSVAMDEGLTHEMAECLSYDIFKQFVTGAKREY